MKNLIAGLIVLVIVAVPITLSWAANTKQDSQVELQANNPYSLQLNLEIKCDWDMDIEEYAFHKHIEILPKKTTVIQLPNRLKKCELWPKIKFFSQK